MPDIGATLREARMRARIDIAEIETATKIRAKYLRALENEEWDLLPGPTFVKTFLRTYAEALGLDAKLLVDEYKMGHERLADSEMRPISPRSRAPTGRTNRRAGGLRPAGGGRGGSRGPVTLVLVVLVLVILAVLGLTQGDEPDRVADMPARTTGPTSPATTSTASPGTAPVKKKKATPKLVRLRVEPTGDVEVCLRAKGQQAPLIGGALLTSGERSRTFRSSRFTIRLGNNAVRLRVNGKAFRPPGSATPIGYRITPTGRTRLRTANFPSCA